MWPVVDNLVRVFFFLVGHGTSWIFFFQFGRKYYHSFLCKMDKGLCGQSKQLVGGFKSPRLGLELGIKEWDILYLLIVFIYCIYAGIQLGFTVFMRCFVYLSV